MYFLFLATGVLRILVTITPSFLERRDSSLQSLRLFKRAATITVKARIAFFLERDRG